MNQIEYRFLQLMVSMVSGDRLTVALLHWDGKTLRTAHSLGPLSVLPDNARQDIRRMVRGYVKHAEKAGRTAEKGGFMYGLAQLFPVREGMGAALYWTPVHVDMTHDPQAHFEFVRSQVRLDQKGRADDAPVTNRDLITRVETEASRLHAKAPDSVKIANMVKHHQAYKVPVSWKNGAWHHVVPMSLDGLDEHGIAKRVRELVGIVELCIPSEDVPVPLAVYPLQPALRDVAREEAHLAEACLASRDVRVVEVARQDNSLVLDPLMNRIRADLARGHWVEP